MVVLHRTCRCSTDRPTWPTPAACCWGRVAAQRLRQLRRRRWQRQHRCGWSTCNWLHPVTRAAVAECCGSLRGDVCVCVQCMLCELVCASSIHEECRSVQEPEECVVQLTAESTPVNVLRLFVQIAWLHAALYLHLTAAACFLEGLDGVPFLLSHCRLVHRLARAPRLWLLPLLCSL